ncbi:MAG: hypothetical protein CMB80_15080 [Flammeovirgaceae bacterium]|nr:hypothetical protein [Flammeovirgaceae bacterium]|tara:strand:- start:170 stop:556 length:387 start_codon:yes stop_codon:yes gene_type:complete
MFNVDSINKDKKNNGVWADFEGGSFLIAYASKMSFQRELARLQQPYARKIDKGTIDPKISLDILAEALSKHVLLDWKNVGANGEEIEYTPEIAKKVIIANDELRGFVSDFSIELENFKQEALEEEGKP